MTGQDLDLQKIQVLESSYQGWFNFKASIVAGTIVGTVILIATMQYQQIINGYGVGIGYSILTVAGFYFISGMKDAHEEHIRFINSLMVRLDKGEKLESLEELRETQKKSVGTKKEKKKTSNASAKGIRNLFRGANSHDLFIAVISGLLVGVLALVPAFWQVSVMQSSLDQQKQEISVLTQQVDIMNQSLVRRPQLVMTVPTRSFTMTHYNGSIQISDSMLPLPRDQNYPFTIYLSNVGDGFAHILCYGVNILTDTNYTWSTFQGIPDVVLKPSESTQINFTLDIPQLFSDCQALNSTRLLESRNLNITFAVASAETTLSQTIQAYWQNP